MVFDFRQIESLSPGQAATAHDLFYAFSFEAAEILSHLLQTTTSFKLVNLSQQPFSKLKREFQYPVCCAKLTVNATQEPALLLINGTIAYAAVDRMLGGKGHLPLHAQNFSNLERAILRKLTSSLLKQLELNFSRKLKVKFSIDEIIAETAEVTGLTPYSTLLAASFAVTMDHLTGNLVIALPTHAIKQLPEEPVEPTPHRKGMALEHIEFDLKVRLGSTSLDPVEFSQLQPGDILPLQRNSEDPLDVLLENQPILHASPGLINVNKGVQIL